MDSTQHLKGMIMSKLNRLSNTDLYTLKQIADNAELQARNERKDVKVSNYGLDRLDKVVNHVLMAQLKIKMDRIVKEELTI